MVKLPLDWNLVDLFTVADQHQLIRPRRRLPSLYPVRAMRQGIDIEHEHTRNWRVAAVIAANHLDEKEDYYTLLLKHVE